MSSLHAVPSPGRRAVTLALTGVLALLTAGCGVRLQEDAPDLPLVPRRPKMPGEEVLLGLLGDTVGLVAATSAASGEVEKALADLHVAQERVLRMHVLVVSCWMTAMRTAADCRTAWQLPCLG